MEPLLAVPLGFVLGFLIGLTGVGGGAVVAPALYVVLGLNYREAVGLSLVYSLFTKIFGAAQHMRQGTVRWKLTLLYGLTGVPGAVLGSQIMYWARGSEAERLFPFFMSAILLIVSALMAMETGLAALAAREKPFSADRISPLGGLAIAGFQLVVGVLVGLTSVGSGSLVILSMLYLFRMSARDIVGSNIVISLIMVVPAGLTHYVAGGVSWRLLGLLLLGSVAGAVLGSRTTLLLPERALKLTIVLLIVVGAVATLIKAW
jgi:uncharacterized membrane protein YfcA